jgi:hypothetical protein
VRRSRWRAAIDDDDFAPYLAGKPAASTEMFWRFLELARSAGPATFELQHGPIVLCGTRRIFASVRVLDAGLRGHLNLLRSVEDRRVARVSQQTQTLMHLVYRVRSLADLDDEFGQWLAEARDVGDGVHLTG